MLKNEKTQKKNNGEENSRDRNRAKTIGEKKQMGATLIWQFEKKLIIFF